MARQLSFFWGGGSSQRALSTPAPFKSLPTPSRPQVGGTQGVILGDERAEALAKLKGRIFGKVVSERAAQPVFDVVVEVEPDRPFEWRVVTNVGRAVDNILDGQPYAAELRRVDPQTGETSVEMVAA